MHRGPGNQWAGGEFQLLKGPQWVCDADNFLRPDPVFLFFSFFFFSVCLNLTDKPSVGNHQFSLSACYTVQPINWESRCSLCPPAVSSCPTCHQSSQKHPEAQDAGAPTLPHSKHPDHGLTLCIIQWPDNQGKNVH